MEVNSSFHIDFFGLVVIAVELESWDSNIQANFQYIKDPGHHPLKTVRTRTRWMIV